jgi:hypothetical protein
MAWAVGQADYPGNVRQLVIEQRNGFTWYLAPVPNPPARAGIHGNNLSVAGEQIADRSRRFCY